MTETDLLRSTNILLTLLAYEKVQYISTLTELFSLILNFINTNS